MKTLAVYILVCLIILLIISGCDKDEIETTLTLTIASETIQRTIVFSQAESEHMMITDASKQTFYLPIGTIENFEYEKGFEYKLLVKQKNLKNSSIYSGSAIYTLIKILSKKKK